MQLELTTSTLARFVRGVAEIQRTDRFGPLRGQIKSITIEGDELRIEFSRLIEDMDLRLLAGVPDLQYSTDLSTFFLKNIRPSTDNPDGRLGLYSSGNDRVEIIQLIPPSTEVAEMVPETHILQPIGILLSMARARSTKFARR